MTIRDYSALVSFALLLMGFVWSTAQTAQRFGEVEKIVPRVEAAEREKDHINWRVELLEEQLKRIDDRTIEIDKNVADIREALIRMGVRLDGKVK